MEKRKKIEATDGEFQLPEAIIQHIQSFLTGKQAAQTTLLSKSWYSAWLTRPNLDFDERDFRKNNGSKDPRIVLKEFSGFAKKMMQRYEESNIKIESFRLSMERAWYGSSDLPKELIVKALKMGATDLNFELGHRDWTLVLPHEVLGSENLVRLSVKGCKIEQGMDGQVRCSRLKFLSLCSVDINSDLIWNIVSSCPLFEQVSVSRYFPQFKLQSSMNAYIEFGKERVRSVGDGPINLYEFHKIRCLLLVNLNIDTLFFCDFSSKFPCLKDLTLHYCTGYEEIRISSPSLECVNYAESRRLKVKFDVPSIRKFTFSSAVFPSLSFELASREWESDVSITYNCPLSTIWFRQLNEFLTKLSMSKISISLSIRSKMGFDYFVGDIQGLPKPEVENLTIDVRNVPSLVCSAFFDGLFRCCRPKFITKNWLPESSLEGKTNNDLLCKILDQGMNEKCSIPNHCMYGLHDLKEVNVQLFDDIVAKWRPLAWKSLLDASTSPEDEQKIQYELRWGPKPSTF